MNATRRIVATVELLLISPAVLFLTALVIRSLQPQQYEPARTAQTIVTWYSLRPHVGLWVLLIALPAVALATGSITLVRGWNEDPELRRASYQTFAALRGHSSMLLIALTTLVAGVILAIVAVHVLAG
jgi:hypothetical protein